MPQHIAVVLNNADQAKPIARYLGDLARPGAVFKLLIPSRVARPHWLMAWTTALSVDSSNAVEVYEQRWRFEIAQETQIAESKLAPLVEAVRSQGAEIESLHYSGSLKRILKDMRQCHGDVLVVLYPREEGGLAKFVRRALTRSGVRASDPRSSAALALWRGAGRSSRG